MWYKDKYRRHLMDMHIEEWDESFLSKLSEDDYIAALKEANVQSAMIYLQSHVGYCYYPTKNGHMHKAFVGRENFMANLADRCRENSITPIGYYSITHNTWAHNKFPAWRMLMANGKSKCLDEEEAKKKSEYSFSDAMAQRYGFCCPNVKEYVDFTVEQIREISEYAHLDGMLYDMPFWPHICYCENCKKRWREENGGEMPINPETGSKEHSMLMNTMTRWMSDFCAKVREATLKYMPGCSVIFNSAYAVLNVSDFGIYGALEHCDYAGGDLYGGLMNQSFSCKFYRTVTKNSPFEYMFSRCEPGLGKHTITKSKDLMLSQVFLTAAHHGATMLIDAIDPDGGFDKRIYKKVGEVFSEEEKYEKYFTGDMIADVGIYYSMKSKFNKYGKAYNCHTASVNLAHNFIENNISFNISGENDDLEKYKMVFAPLLTSEDESENEKFVNYVKNGGVLYLSGAQNEKLTEELLNVKVKGVTKEAVTYMSPKDGNEDIFEYFSYKYPVAFDTNAALLETEDDDSAYATLTLPYTNQNEGRFASIHSNPPGKFTNYPAMIVKKYGKGTVIWSAQPIEDNPLDIFKIIICNLADKFVGLDNLKITSSAPRNTELISFENSDSITISAVNLNEHYYADTVIPFEVKVASDKKPCSVELLPGGEKIAFDYDGKKVAFSVRSFKIFDMYRINYDKE